MRYTVNDAFNVFRDDTGNHNNADTALQTYFLNKLTSRYQKAFSEINNRQTQKVLTGSTVVNQQFYHYPPGILDLADCTVTINGLAYPVITDDSILQWDRINLVLISTTALPQFIFPRKDDFGIWPIPQGVYTMTITVQLRDRTPNNILDYSGGTINATNNSTTIVGSGTSFGAFMKGYWFVMNDVSQPGEGYWYRIASVTDSTHLTLETFYTQDSVTSAAYRIGQSFELPEEVHDDLIQGVVADYYRGPRSDMAKADECDNIFWTGNSKTNVREGMTFTGGILGAKQRYAGRADGAIVWQHGLSTSWTDRQWASSITP